MWNFYEKIKLFRGCSKGDYEVDRTTSGLSRHLYSGRGSAGILRGSDNIDTARYPRVLSSKLKRLGTGFLAQYPLLVCRQPTTVSNHEN